MSEIRYEIFLVDESGKMQDRFMHYEMTEEEAENWSLNRQSKLHDGFVYEVRKVEV